jgi:hypothetical protein
MAVVLSALAAGCGSSSDTTETVTTTTEAAPTRAPDPHVSTGLTMPEFIAAADAICKEENARIKPRSEELSALGDGPESQESLDAMADGFRSLGTAVEEGVAKLHALPPPPGKVQAIESMLNIASSQAVLVNSVADAVSTGDSIKIESLGEQISLNQAKYRGLTQSLGFRQCGSS